MNMHLLCGSNPDLNPAHIVRQGVLVVDAVPLVGGRRCS